MAIEPHQEGEKATNSGRTEQISKTTRYNYCGDGVFIRTHLFLHLIEAWPQSKGYYLRFDGIMNSSQLINPREITGPPKMNLLIEGKRTPALIIKPRLLLVVDTDARCVDTCSKVQQDYPLSKCFVKADRVLHQICIPIFLVSE